MQDQIDKLYADIKAVNVQGATNVALATLEGMQLTVDQGGPGVLEKIELVGVRLSTARENEPLARNAVRYVLEKLKNASDNNAIEQARAGIAEFKHIIEQSKQSIKRHAVEVLMQYNTIFTHCHSSTANSAIIEVFNVNPRLKVIATETRPLFQGRKTAAKLLEVGVDVTQIVDSLGAYFIVEDKYLPIEVVIIGADEVLADGRCINKVGSYQLALAAKEDRDKFFVLASLLKMDFHRQIEDPVIEMRPAEEVWPEAPGSLKIINPSFELIPSNFVSGYITEAGLLQASELTSKAKEIYPWI